MIDFARFSQKLSFFVFMFFVLLNYNLALANASTDAISNMPGHISASAELQQDPMLVTGQLANGMRYFLLKNATPKGQISLRLRIGSGSLEEKEDQQGLAHFLEHMAFKGSAHVPADAMVKILQRKGLAFGPDTNAFTSWGETVYMLDLPQGDQDSLDTGLFLFRETANRLTLDPKAMESERGVVLSEERLDDTPDFRTFKAKIAFELEDQLAAKRLPIGLADIIKTAPVLRLRDYYVTNYRPQRAQLVAVGDFDPLTVEAKIKTLFSDWVEPGVTNPVPDLGIVKPRGLQFQVMTVPGQSGEVDLNWLKPYKKEIDSTEKRRKDLLDGFVLAILNRRLEALSRSKTPPFIQASAEFSPIFYSAKEAAVSATFAPGGWEKSLAALEQEVRRLVFFGVRADELNREQTDIRAHLVNAVEGAATRKTSDLAKSLIDCLDDERVFHTPQNALDLFDDFVKTITPEKIHEAAKTMFSGSGPLVEINTPFAIEGGEATVARAYNASVLIPVSPLGLQTAISWPYQIFGKEDNARIIENKPVNDLGTVQTKFANGVTLTVKPTAFHKDQVLILVKIGHGLSVLPKDKISPSWASEALASGGVGKLSQDDMQRILAGHVYSISAKLAEDGFFMEGRTRPSDFLIQMQVLTAYLTDPGLRPEAFERERTALLTHLDEEEATAEGVLSRDLPSFLTDQDLRYRAPDRESLTQASVADLQTFLKHLLDQGLIDITVVGDVKPEEVTSAVLKTFATLPARDEAATSSLRPVHFPAPSSSQVTLYHKGRADQAIGLAAWPIKDFYTNTQMARSAIILQEILQNRLIDQLRVAEGATYSPQGYAKPSEIYPDYGYMFDFVETPPQKIPNFFGNLKSMTQDLRARPPTADEMLRAIKPHIAQITKGQQTNDYWLMRLSGSIDDPRRLDLIRTSLSGYAALTPEDIQKAAEIYLKDETLFKLVVVQKNPLVQ